MEISLQYVDDITSRISAFANNIYNAEGGTHITGFKTALTRSLNNFNKGGSGKEGDSFTGDVRRTDALARAHVQRRRNQGSHPRINR